MATTTNYSWSTPDDTALVKDGAAAIRSLGTAIDSTVFTNAGAAINKSLVDAAGDLIYGTADNTVARLAIGTADQVLKVNSGATAPEWGTAPSGGMTLISTTTLTGATINLTSIPSTYNSLRLVIQNFLPANDGVDLRMRINSVTSNSYTDGRTTTAGSGNISFGVNNIENILLDQDNATSQSLAIVDFPDYANSNTWKIVNILGISVAYDNTAQANLTYCSFFHNQTAAISTINLFCSGGNFTSGTALLYGVK
jgi:hypothetical protein